MNRFPLEPLGFLKWIVLSLVVVLTLQTFNIQVLNREVYQKKTMSLVTRSKNIYAERGQIMDRNGVVLADNFRDTANKALDYSRVFLQGKLASQVIGKLDFNGHGVMGVERVFDERLSGNEGFRVSVQDAHRREVYSRSENLAEAVPGKNLVLTIDKNMQELVEKGLKDGVTKYSATSASAVVVDPYTGEILAMASYPTFDPNSKTQGIGRVAKNEIVSMSYEPGSTFKVVTAAAALENNVVDPEKVFANEGKSWSWNPRSAPIRDSHVYGDMNMTQAMVRFQLISVLSHSFKKGMMLCQPGLSALLNIFHIAMIWNMSHMRLHTRTTPIEIPPRIPPASISSFVRFSICIFLLSFIVTEL